MLSSTRDFTLHTHALQLRASILGHRFKAALALNFPQISLSRTPVFCWFFNSLLAEGQSGREKAKDGDGAGSLDSPTEVGLGSLTSLLSKVMGS